MNARHHRAAALAAATALAATAVVTTAPRADAADPVEIVGSLSAFAVPGSDCGTPDAVAGYVQIDGGTTGVEWDLDGIPVGEVSDPVQRFPMPGGFQGIVTASALPGYYVPDHHVTTFALTVNPCPVVDEVALEEVDPETPVVEEPDVVESGEGVLIDALASLRAEVRRLVGLVDRLRDRLDRRADRIENLRDRLDR